MIYPIISCVAHVKRYGVNAYFLVVCCVVHFLMKENQK